MPIQVTTDQYQFLKILIDEVTRPYLWEDEGEAEKVRRRLTSALDQYRGVLVSEERFTIKGILDFGIRLLNVPKYWLAKHAKSGQYVVFTKSQPKKILLMTSDLNKALHYFLTGIKYDDVPLVRKKHYR